MNIRNISAEVIKIQSACWNQVIKPYFNNLTSTQVKTKAHAQDFQTEADVKSEEYLTKHLQNLIPNSLVLGEEALADEKVGFDIFKTAQKDQYIWVIDPIDGTNNFVNGRKDFGIIVALVQNNETIGGWINLPKRKKSISALKGRGTFYKGKQSYVSQNAGLENLTVHGATFYDSKVPDYKVHFNKCAKDVSRIGNYRCAAASYLALSIGKIDAYIQHHSNPWDHLAGVLIAEEAGAIATQWNGRTYKPMDYSSQLILANAPNNHQALKERFINPLLP